MFAFNVLMILLCLQKVKVLVAKSCPSLCDPMDSSSSGSIVHGILQARMLEWVVMPSSRLSSQPRGQTQVSCIAGSFFTIWATRDVPYVYNMHPNIYTPYIYIDYITHFEYALCIFSWFP